MDFTNKKSSHHYIGALGEEIAKNYLESRGYKTIERNYRKKWGEIDIIMSKKKKIHFVEVKSVSERMGVMRKPKIQNPKDKDDGKRALTRNIIYKDKYNPADNVHPFKIKRIYRAAESFLGERGRGEKSWQIDLVSVYIDTESKKAKVNLLENIF